MGNQHGRFTLNNTLLPHVISFSMPGFWTIVVAKETEALHERWDFPNTKREVMLVRQHARRGKKTQQLVLTQHKFVRTLKKSQKTAHVGRQRRNQQSHVENVGLSTQVPRRNAPSNPGHPLRFLYLEIDVVRRSLLLWHSRLCVATCHCVARVTPQPRRVKKLGHRQTNRSRLPYAVREPAYETREK